MRIIVPPAQTTSSLGSEQAPRPGPFASGGSALYAPGAAAAASAAGNTPSAGAVPPAAAVAAVASSVGGRRPPHQQEGDDEPLQPAPRDAAAAKRSRRTRSGAASGTSDERARQDGGYNSADEYGGPRLASRYSQPALLSQLEGVEPEQQGEEEGLAAQLERRGGLQVEAMARDGNCLFRAVARQVYGDAEMHDEVRARCVDYMRRERDHYAQFIASESNGEDFDAYVARKSRDGCYGNNLEIQAISEIYNRPVEIFTDRAPINIFHDDRYTSAAASSAAGTKRGHDDGQLQQPGEHRGQDSNDVQQQQDEDEEASESVEPIRLHYEHGNHYNAVIDPRRPSVGVGLGLPGIERQAQEARRAERRQLSEALQQSARQHEQRLIDQQLLAYVAEQAELERAERELEASVLNESRQAFQLQQQQQLQQLQQRQLREVLTSALLQCLPPPACDDPDTRL